MTNFPGRLLPKIVYILLAAIPATDAAAQGSRGLVMQNGDTVFCDYRLKDNYFSVKSTGKDAQLLPSSNVRSVFSTAGSSVVLFLRLESYTDNPSEIFDPMEKKPRVYDTTLLLNTIYATTKMNLYKAVDKSNVEYYFVKKPQEVLPRQLVVRYSMYYAKVGELISNSSPNLLVQRLYIGQLKELMSDCQRLTPADFDVVDYRGYSFKKIIRKYNQRCR